MIDVLLPTRDRPDMLVRSVESLFATADHPEQVRIMAAVDPDDRPSWAAALGLLNPSLLNYVCVTERHGYEGLHHYYNELAARSDGDWLLVWNDDALMTTPGWDTQVTRLPPWILIGDLQSPHSPLCCFPAVRRSAVQALGRFCSDNPHVDTFWQDIGYRTGTIRYVHAYVAHAKAGGARADTLGFYGPRHQAVLQAAARIVAGALP